MKDSKLKVIDFKTTKEPIKVLGNLSYNSNKCVEENFFVKIQKMITKLNLMAFKRSHDIREVFIGESFGYITASLCSFHVDCSRICCQDCSKEPFCFSMEKQERQNKKSSYVSNSKKEGINFANFCTVIKALHLAWIGRLLSTSDDKWKAIPQLLLSKTWKPIVSPQMQLSYKTLENGPSSILSRTSSLFSRSQERN